MLRRGHVKSLQEQELAPTKCRNVRVAFAKQAMSPLTISYTSPSLVTLKHSLPLFDKPPRLNSIRPFLTKFIAVDTTEALSA
jgi:hypothetical protein